MNSKKRIRTITSTSLDTAYPNGHTRARTALRTNGVQPLPTPSVYPMRPWLATSREVINEALGPIFGAHGLTPAQIESGRTYMLRNPPRMEALLEEFMRRVLAQPQVSAAFLHPYRAHGHHLDEWIVPYAQAVRSAATARNTPTVLPNEAAVAWVAAFFSCTSLFISLPTTSVPRPEVGASPDSVQSLMLEGPLKWLRGASPALGALMSFLLGHPHWSEEDIDVERAAWLQAAVKTACIPVESYWRQRKGGQLVPL